MEWSYNITIYREHTFFQDTHEASVDTSFALKVLIDLKYLKY